MFLQYFIPTFIVLLIQLNGHSKETLVISFSEHSSDDSINNYLIPVLDFV